MLALLSVGLLVAVGTVGGSGHTISVSGENDVPSWSFEVDGETYTTDSVAIVSGGQISFSTTAPSSNGTYNAYLYDREGNIVQQRRLEGDASGSFNADCGSCTPGTYLVAVSDEEIEDATPVIIEGHSVDISAPSSVEPGSNATVDITASGSPSSVELIMGQNDPIRISADGSGGDYTATIHADEFEAGTYDVYGATLNGDELTGLSDRASIKIEESDSTNGSTDEGSSGGGGGGGGGAAPQPSTEFNVTDVTINSTTIDAGSAVATTVTVENVGDADGEYEIRLRTDLEIVTSETVAVDEGATEKETLVTTFNSSGEFDLTVDDFGEFTTLTVDEVEGATATPTTSETPSNTDAENTDTATETVKSTSTDEVITPGEGTASETEGDGSAPSLPIVMIVLSMLGVWIRHQSRR